MFFLHWSHFVDRLDCNVRCDVFFIVTDESFPAHCVVLAVCSPVFRAELFGSMAETTVPSIMLQDIGPATFKIMLWFMYTDVLPGEDELRRIT
jgi:speckle-type POZ protein